MEGEMSENWLEKIQAGNEVVLRLSGFSRDRYVMEKVTRTTATQVVVGNRGWRKSDGKEIGGSTWHYNSIRPGTPETREQVTRTDALDRLGKQQSWKTLTTDQLTRIVAILDEAANG
jgi:hypothetical protein